MNLRERLDLLERLGNYMLSEEPEWLEAKLHARISNAWFTDDFIAEAVDAIAKQYLDRQKLEAWAGQYRLPGHSRKVGIVMAGNIPLVGFHDFLCGFVSGHQLYLKLSSKDMVLLSHLIRKLSEWNPEVMQQVHIAEMLKGCEAYIATGSNNSSRYFEEYFGKYPHLIRRNRTSVAVLDGAETTAELEALCRDVFLYYGLGCRNVTQLCVPEGYDFTLLFEASEGWRFLLDHHKYKNNFDYHLALYLLNKVPYLSNELLLLVENSLPFSAVSVLHYQFYQDRNTRIAELQHSTDIQCLVGHGLSPFGAAQQPGLNDYADGADTMAFLCSL